MTYQVDIRLGPWSWTFLQDAVKGATTPDGLLVLGGLTFGWQMPDGAWPQQPAPMTCQLAVNAPGFAGTLLDGSGDLGVMTVEVKADTAGPVIARFYGDVTDFKAVPRRGRPGVTITAAAVDYTVRLKENYYYGVLHDVGSTDHDAITRLWQEGNDPASEAGTGLGDRGSTIVWSAPDRQIEGDAADVSPRIVADIIGQILLQGVDIDNSRRMILAPMVGADGELLGVGADAYSTHGRTFTLDVVDSDIAAGTTVWTLPAAAVRNSDLTWSWNKTTAIYRVDVRGWGGESSNVAWSTSTFVDSPARSGSTTLVLDSNLVFQSDAQEVANFYTDRSRSKSWQLDKLTVEVTRAQRDGVSLTVPVGLFPDWTQGEDDLDRAACYSAVVNITGADASRTPDGASSVLGRLVGATCTVAGGELVLQLALRRFLDVTADDPAYVFPAYGTGAYGAMAHV